MIRFKSIVIAFYFSWQEKRKTSEKKEPAMSWAGHERMRIKYKRREIETREEKRNQKSHSLKWFLHIRIMLVYVLHSIYK